VTALSKAEADINALDRQLAETRRRMADAERQKNAAEAELDGFAKAQEGSASPRDLETARDAAAREVIAAEEHSLAARERRVALDNSSAQARSEAEEASAAVQRLEAEIAGLDASLSALAAGRQPHPALDETIVEPGYEAALAAALGDDLSASLDEGAPYRWAVLPEVAGVSSPDGTTPLAKFVKAPPLLHRPLHGIGIVEPERGDILQAALLPGQSLVTREGRLWRWDGLVRESGLASAESSILMRRNRLAALAEQREAAVKNALSRRDLWETARLEAAAALKSERESMEGQSCPRRPPARRGHPGKGRGAGTGPATR
jgi:chromosome segregation protein